MTHFGQLSDLVDVKRESEHKTRYNCPYCDTVHGKTPDTRGCFVYDHNTQTGTCFRCQSRVVHEGLRDPNFILKEIEKSSNDEIEEAKAQALNLQGWTTPVFSNGKVYEYMKKRGFKDETLHRFNIKACNSPSEGVVFCNNVTEEDLTNFYQIRFLDFHFKHSMLEGLHKQACWLDYADSPRLIIVEGFSSGLSAYEHTLELENYYNPVVICGNSLTNVQLVQIKEFCRKHLSVKINICLDGGFFEHALKVADKLYKKCNNVDIEVTYLPGMLDPNEMDKKSFLTRVEDSYYYEPHRLQFIRNHAYK